MTKMCRHILLLAVVVSVTFITDTHAKTVVFLPPPVTSYMVYHSNVAGALASLGHDVWISVPHYLMSKNLVKDPTVHVLEYGEKVGDIAAKVMASTNILDKFWAGEDAQGVGALFEVCSVFMKLSREILSDDSFVNKVKSLKPDLIVLESVPFNMNMIVLPYMLDIPYALIGTIHDVILAKVPFSPAATPFPSGNLSDKMSFLERLKCTLFYLARMNFDLLYDSTIVSEFAPHKPYKTINELAANSEVFIAEVDYILDYPRTTLPNTKLIGGSSGSVASPLAGEFKKFVDEATKGIIVASFGGSVVDIPTRISSKMVSAFKQLDLRVVWRVNITSPDPNQFLTSKWLPQNDLLGHEKTKLFISHCGKNGQYEALYHAVPILCLPMFGDQGYNSQRIVVKQLGLRADMREASADELAGLMKEIIYTGKYTENMKKASLLYRELYKVPKKEAAYWFDHVMKFGGEYMRSAGQQMPWYQLYVLDVIGFLFGVIFLFVLSMYFLVKQLYLFFRSSSGKIKPKRH